MITTRLCRLAVSDIQWQLAHLFEHVLIAGFRNFLATRGHSKDLFGWLNGETFESYLFLEGGFYDPATAELFDEYLANLPRFTEDEIARSLRTIEAEERAVMKVTDYEKVQRVFEVLSRRTRGSQPVLDQRQPMPLIEEAGSPKDFRSITLAVGAANLSVPEQKLLLRLYVILIDVIENALREQFGAYATGRSSVVDMKDGYAFFVKATFARNSVTMPCLKAACAEALHAFDVTANMAAIMHHFNAFAAEPLWKDLSIEYYRHAGIVATNAEIAGYATTENVQSLIQKLGIGAFASNKHSDRHIH